MAQRRMFSKEITDSDAFLDMPLSTQALYFHIGMKADDDGFCSGVKTLCRTIGANKNDLDLLIAKNFLIEFDDGVIVVKHWRLNNFIRKDAYKPTNYVESKNLLFVKKNGVYTLDSTQGVPILSNEFGFKGDNVNKLSTQDRIGKDRLGKDSLEKKIKLDKSKFRQAELCEMLVEKSFVSEDDLKDPSWDNLLNSFVEEHGYLDTKIKLKYFLDQTKYVGYVSEKYHYFYQAMAQNFANDSGDGDLDDYVRKISEEPYFGEGGDDDGEQ